MADSASSNFSGAVVAARRAMMATLAEAELRELQDGLAAMGAVEVSEMP